MRDIPVYQPDLAGNERKYVLECLDSTWISSKGRFIADFESDFARFVGSPHAASVCNGTVALHLALVALGIGPGDEVIVPSLTYIASVNAITYTGATAVFADSLPDTWQLDPADVERRITPRTRAVMAVHLYGGACDMRSLRAICDRHGLKLIEDCAEAFGTRLDGIHVGNFGDIGTFSFFGNKTITTGEGGMLICRDTEIDRRIRHFKGQGLATNREYWHDVIGYNYRMTNICAAIGLAQLERADDIIRRKAELAARYRTLLAGTPLVFQACGESEIASHWMVTVLVPQARQRDPLREHLRAEGVETRPVFYPVHTMPIYPSDGLRLPVAEDIAARGINLPSWPTMTPDDMERIAVGVEDFFRTCA